MRHDSLSSASEIALEDDIDGEFDWRAVMIAARERLWLLIVLPVLGAVIGWAYMKRTPPVYQSRATLEIDDKQQIVKVDDVADTNLRVTNTMNTLVATVQSKALLQTIADNNDFHELPGFLGAAHKSRPATKDDVVHTLRGSLKAAIRNNTWLVDISATHTDPKAAELIAQAAVNGMILFGANQKSRLALEANNFLVKEEERLRKALEEAENELQDYREKHDALSLEKDQNLVVAKLNDINGKLNAATAQRVQLETDFSALDSSSNDMESLLALPSVSGHPVVSEITKAIASKKAELAVMKNRYTPVHPKYIALETEIANLGDQRKKALPEVATQLRAALEATRTNEAKYKEALIAQEQEVLALDRLAVQYNSKRRAVDAIRSVYDSVASRLKEVDLTKGLEDNPLRVHEPASGAYQIWPSAVKVYATSVGGALIGAMGVTLLFFFMDRSVKTVDQAEKLLGLPVMGAIGFNKKLSGHALDVWKEPHGVIAESFRSLRALSTELGREDERRSFLITSAMPSEGKTFCASNFATSLAQQGLKTLLIDADLRRPQISQTFYGKDLKPGLTEYLVGKAPLNACIRESEAPNLSIITAGTRSPNPAELLAGSGIKRLLQEAQTKYDRIVIDSAPVVAVADTILIASFVDTIFQVVRWNKTSVPVVARSIAMLRKAGKRPAGLILNQLPVNSASCYYYYSSGYYGSKDVYEASA